MALKDSDNLKRIEEMRPEYERLREEKIRNDADLARGDRDIKDAHAAAVELAGTSNLDELRLQITSDYEKNTKDVDAFSNLLTEIRSGLTAIEGEA